MCACECARECSCAVDWEARESGLPWVCLKRPAQGCARGAHLWLPGASRRNRAFAVSARDAVPKEEDRRLMTRGRRLPSDGSARCLAVSAAQLRTPYVRVAGSPLRAGAREQRKSRAESAAEPGRPRYAPSPADSRGAPPSRAGHSVAESAPDASSAPVLPSHCRSDSEGAGFVLCAPVMRSGLRGSPEQPSHGGHPRLTQGASR